MKKKTITIIALLAILAVSALVGKSILTSSAEGQKVKVYTEGNAIVYDGPMAASAVEETKKLYTPDIKRLIINSPGGEINIGMDLGDWVYEKGLDVEVKSIAFSSAANYVFTSGKDKYLHKDSMVGWHGGVTQDSKNPIMSFFMKKYVEEGKLRETDFFKKIGVDQMSTVYGLKPEFNKYSEKDGYVGWTYSLEAMEAMGIKNIHLIDGEWSPADQYNGKKIFTITKDDLVQSN